MYNRYIPQNDGTYCRKTVTEHPPSKPAPPPPPVRTPPCPPPPPRPPSPKPSRPPQNGALGFLKQLLPRDFSAEDLLVVLLLLLMAGDCREDQNSALLTLALYLFL